MRDTSSTFDDTSTSDDSTKDTDAAIVENMSDETGSYGTVSAYYDKNSLPKKKTAGFDRFKPDMPIGTFVIKEKQSSPSEAGIILNNRIGRIDGPIVRVGGELKENKNFQARALELAKLTEMGRAATAAGFELYTNARGEPVFKIPQEYQDSIAAKATEGVANSTKKIILERFSLLAVYISRLSSLEARGNLVGVNTKKYTTTVNRLIDAAKKEEGEGEFNETLGVIEVNLTDFEDVVAAKEKEKKNKETSEQAVHLGLLKDLEVAQKEKTDAISSAEAAQKKANDQVASEKKKIDDHLKDEEARLATQAKEMADERSRLLVLIKSYSVALGNFLKAEAQGELIITSLSDQSAQTVLIESAQELNQIKNSFTESPSSEALNTFKKKIENYISLVQTLIKQHPIKEQVDKQKEIASTQTFFDIDAGWPSEAIKQEKKDGENTPHWVLVSKDGSSKELSNSALWSSLATKFDDVFTLYQDFFDGPERTQKLQSYSNLITNKNEIIAALLNLDTDKLSTDDDQDLILRFKKNIEAAVESWNTVLKERDIAKQKKAEQEKLLERLTTYNVRLSEIENLQTSLLPFQGTRDQQESLAKAKTSAIAKQQEVKKIVESGIPLTETIVSEYRDCLDVVSSLLTALKKDKDAFEIEQKAEQDRLTALFRETEPSFSRINDQVEAILSDITSPTELAMVTGRFDMIVKERKNIVDNTSNNQPLTEEMIKTFAKHLQDFDKGMLSGVQNRLRTLHQDEQEASPSQKNRVLLPDGRLGTEDDDKKSENPEEQVMKGIEGREENPLKSEYAKWARRDFSSFIRWYMKESPSWKEGDKNKLAAEPVVNAHIEKLEVKKNELETRKEESFRIARESEGSSGGNSLLRKQLDALNGEIDEIAKEIAYLKCQEIPKKTSTDDDLVKESTQQKKPFTNRLKVGTAGEIRPAKSASQNSTVEETRASNSLSATPFSTVVSEEKKTSSQETTGPREAIGVEKGEQSTITVEINKTESGTHEPDSHRTETEQKTRKDAVSKLLLTRLHVLEKHKDEVTKQIAGIIGPVPFQTTTDGGANNTKTSQKTETIASKSSWRDFLNTDTLQTFAACFVDDKIGFTRILARFAPSVAIDPKNPASLSAVSSMSVHKLIYGEEGVYGLDETKRKELSDIVRYLDIILRSVKSQKTLEDNLSGDDFSTCAEDETFESYFDRALRETEQEKLQEEKARQGHLYKKTS